MTGERRNLMPQLEAGIEHQRFKDESPTVENARTTHTTPSVKDAQASATMEPSLTGCGV
jgi:hypothetical protein